MLSNDSSFAPKAQDISQESHDNHMTHHKKTKKKTPVDFKNLSSSTRHWWCLDLDKEGADILYQWRLKRKMEEARKDVVRSFKRYDENHKLMGNFKEPYLHPLSIPPICNNHTSLGRNNIVHPQRPFSHDTIPPHRPQSRDTIPPHRPQSRDTIPPHRLQSHDIIPPHRFRSHDTIPPHRPQSHDVVHPHKHLSCDIIQCPHCNKGTTPTMPGCHDNYNYSNHSNVHYHSDTSDNEDILEDTFQTQKSPHFTEKGTSPQLLTRPCTRRSEVQMDALVCEVCADTKISEVSKYYCGC